MRLALSNQGKNNNKRGTTFRKNPKPALRKSMAYKQKSNFTVQVGSDLHLGEVLAHDHPAGEIARHFLRKDLQIALVVARPMMCQCEHLGSGARSDLADRVAGGQRVLHHTAKMLILDLGARRVAAMHQKVRA